MRIWGEAGGEHRRFSFRTWAITGVTTAATVLASLAAVDSLAVTHGLVRSVALAGLLFFGVLLLAALFARPFRLRSIVRPVVFVLTVTSAIVLLVGPGKASHHESASPPATSSPSASQLSGHATESTSDSTSSAPKPQPVVGSPIPPPDKCGPDAVNAPLPPVQVCVNFWCRGDVFNQDGTADKAHAQIKIRPRIINNGASTLQVDIRPPSAIRLIVSESHMPGSWGPPPLTAAAGDPPSS